MNAIEMLTKQHRQMESALKAALDADGASRRELFTKAADVLMSHVLIEEQVFYPAVKAKRTEDILLESLEEHLSLKRLISDLLELRSNATAFDPKLHVLIEQAEHHHEEEEEKLFPKVTKLLTGAELDELGERMGAAQAKLLAADPRELAPEQKDEAATL